MMQMMMHNNPYDDAGQDGDTTSLGLRKQRSWMIGQLLVDRLGIGNFGQSVAGIILAAVLVVSLAACGKTQVYREAGSGRASSSGSARSSAKPGQTIIVQSGDNLSRLGRIHGVSALDLALWNGIEPPYTIYPGQRLQLSPSAAKKTISSGATTSRPSSTRPSQTPPGSSVQAPARSPSPSPFSWRWPTDGQVVTRFEQSETTRQGVDIGGRSGQPVRASVGGLVVYSGAGLVGYGELVIIKHDEQWLSVYGHNRTRLVSEGAQVKAGEQIAEMGRTGAARDMLHFEIRYNGRPVDPLQYLPAR